VIRRYMTIWYLGAAFLVVPMMVNGVLRAHGDAKTPRDVMILIAIGNAILDPLLIFGAGPIPALHLEGAALATAIARAIGLVYTGAIVIRAGLLELHFPTPAEFADSAKRILQVGLPATVTNVVGPLATAMLTAIVATHGAAAVAAYGIGARVEGLIMLAPIALSSAVSPFVGQNWGAHLPERVEEGFRVSVRFCIAWGLGALLVLLPLAGPIAGIFSSEPGVVEATRLYLWVVPIGYAGYGVLLIVNSAFNALDHASRATLLSLLRSVAFAVPAAWLLNLWLGLTGVFLGLALGPFLAALVGLRWMKVLVDPELKAAEQQNQVEDIEFLIERAPEALRADLRELVDAALALEGVAIHRIRGDAVGFFVGHRQLGHAHPSGHFDLPLPQELGDYMVEQGRVEHHRMQHQSGWFTHALHDTGDVIEAGQLIHLAHALYEIQARGPDDPLTRAELDALGLAESCRAALVLAASRWGVEEEAA